MCESIVKSRRGSTGGLWGSQAPPKLAQAPPKFLPTYMHVESSQYANGVFCSSMTHENEMIKHSNKRKKSERETPPGTELMSHLLFAFIIFTLDTRYMQVKSGAS